MSDLIIVESPAKAKTIGQFLGKNYTVIASKGHIRDLPKSKFGINIEGENFTPEYRVSSDHTAIVKQIKAEAKKAGTIYLATDEDREGEAIAYHIATAIGKEPLSLPRIVFHEITKSAISNALATPRKLDMNSVNAQQARRLLDRIVGYKLSPLLNKKVQKGLSAGRVQSAALKILVDKEREINAFVPEDYFVIASVFVKDLNAELVEFEGNKIEKLSIKTQEMAQKIKDRFANEEFSITNIEIKERKTSPQPPFMTSTLQQSASNRLGFSPKKTMMLAQTLYEGVQTHAGFSGAITYMRTDSLNIAQEAQKKALEVILQNFGEQYAPKQPNTYATKSKGAQEAHEAIRPTNLDFTPALAKQHLDKDLARLYELIYNRFLASQMTPSVSQLQNVSVTSKSGEFKISGRKMLFEGFYKVYGEADKELILPALSVGQKMTLQSIDFAQKTTEPPTRYSEAGLVKKLESLGIGRPSTYAPTISLLQSRDYVKTEKKVLIPQEISFKIMEVLEGNFEDIVSSDFTSKMESRLDDVAENKEDWQKLLAEFYYPFVEKIAEKEHTIKSLKIYEPTGEKCPKCGGELVKRGGRFGEFVACGNYPKCKFIQQDQAAAQNAKTGEACPECGGELVEKIGRFGKFVACGNYPQCKFIKKDGTKPQAQKVGRNCPKCGKDLVQRQSKRGAFVACSGYPKCKFIEKSGESQPQE